MDELTERNEEKKSFFFARPSVPLLGEKYDLFRFEGADALLAMLDCNRENEMKLRAAEDG